MQDRCGKFSAPVKEVGRGMRLFQGGMSELPPRQLRLVVKLKDNGVPAKSNHAM